MRLKNLLFILGSLVCFEVSSQDFNIYKKTAKENYNFLLKDASVKRMVVVDDEGLKISAPNNELFLYWTEVNHFLDFFTGESLKYGSFKTYFDNKQRDPIAADEHTTHYRQELLPESFVNLRVALDPGHSAEDIQEATRERKYLRIHRDSIDGINEDLELIEAQLNYATALLIRDSLYKLGAEVFITREYGHSAVGKDFNEWYEEDLNDSLINMYSKLTEDVSESFAKQLKNRNDPKNRSNARKFYEFLDFVNRGRRINEWSADVTFVLHYNAHDDSRRYKAMDEDGKPVYYNTTTKENYSMVFIPGGFVNGELSKWDTFLDLSRLMVTTEFSKSRHLASHLIDEFKSLGIQPFPESLQKNHFHLNKYAVATGEDGIYARNLYLLRAVRGAVVYGEPFYQDSEDELEYLKYPLRDVYGIKVSDRIFEVANAYIASLYRFLDQNKKINAGLEASVK